MKHLEVVAGIIVDGDRILCVQKGKVKQDYLSFKFEFPGGKIEEGESRPEALKRELKEELFLDIEVEEKDYFQTIEYCYPDFKLVMHTYLCTVYKPVFLLNEHISYVWSKASELNDLDWADAD